MKVEDATDTVAKFFNDLIGAWVPGTALTVGLVLMHLGPGQLRSLFELGDTISATLTLAGVLFAIGHTLLALHEQILKEPLSKLGLTRSFNEAGAKMLQSCVWFGELVKARQTGAEARDWEYKDLRSVALSVSTEAASLGRRFTFISLLCYGVGTALAILALDLVACSLFFPQLLFAYDEAAPWSIQAILLLLVALALFRQGDAFHSRAMKTPFSVAVAELIFKRDANGRKTGD
ncbi:hypothetical protein GCM10028794_24390 [Silanimonas algicola]